MKTEDSKSAKDAATIHYQASGHKTSSFLHLFLQDDTNDKTNNGSFLDVAEKLKLTLQSLEVSPSADIFESSVQKIQTILKQAERYVTKHMAAANNNPQKHKKLLANIYRVLQEEAIDLVLRLNVEMPLDEGDDPAQLLENTTNTNNTEERFLFPPLLHQVLSGMEDRLSDGTGSTANLSLDGDWSDDDDDSIASFLSNDSRLDPDYVPWQFHNLTTGKGWGVLASPSSAFFHSSASRVERRNYYQRIQALRALPQDTTRITRIRVVLAQLDPGDTTPVVLAGQTVATAVLGPLYAFNAGFFFGGKALLTGKNALGDPTEGAMADAKLAATSAFRYAQHSFLHFLLEFDLEVESSEDDEEKDTNSTITCTLERCADDVYLYQGESARPHHKQVFFAKADHLRLRDLIRFRNQQRQEAYRLRGNNCKDFVWQFLLQTYPGFKSPSGYSFNSSCQAIYGSDWPPSDFNETMEILMQQRAQPQPQETQPTKKISSEEEEEERPQESSVLAALQRKRVNLWVGSFRNNDT